MNTHRQYLAYAVVCIFLIFFFSSGLTAQVISVSVSDFFSTKNTFPDFSHYKSHRILSEEEYPTDSRNKRVIIIGDIHGSSKPFQTLLSKLSYDADFDTLIHVGDIISRGKHDGSLDVLSYMASHNVTGVRGNHDQKVLEWRAWMEWIRGFEGGGEWLAEVDEREGLEGGLRRCGKWIKKIPKGWRMFSDHHRIARDMTQKQYKYLLSLPLVLYVPSAHTYIVHAGLLPYDPTRDQNHPRQPLSHLPIPFAHLAGLQGITHTTPKATKTDVERMRFLQELGLLHDIPQNLDPWVKLNIRGVRKNHKVTSKSKKGTPWSEIWNAAMAKCGGFDMDVWEDEQDLKKKGKGGKLFPCRPSTVVYGHAAARGLDIKRWSIGTDTGCAYGRRLSALVIGPKSSSSFDEIDEDEHDLQSIPYGDDGRGQIVSIKCRL